jgi:hypothetical protein
MNHEKDLRDRLLYVLKGKGAHLDFDKAISDFSPNYHGKKYPALPYTAWQLLEHMRIAQWDILEFSRNKRHVSPKWPEEYWPNSESPTDDKSWDKSVTTFKRELKEMQDLVTNPETDLYAKIPQGNGQTILREALLLADHNAYHLGQLVMLRKILSAWND